MTLRHPLVPLSTLRWTPELVAILLVYFVQGAIGISRLAVSFFLKDDLGLDPAQVAAMTGVAVIPWTIKPLYGWLSDQVPWRGYRRRPYLILAGGLGSLAWLAMALWVQDAVQAMVAMVAGSMAIAVADVVVDSLVVERSRDQDWAGTSYLQSLSWGVTALGSLMTAYWGGSLLQWASPRWVFGLAACLPLVVIAAAFGIQEIPKPSQQRSSSSWTELTTLWQTLRQPHVLLPVAFVFLWQATPSSEAAFFYFVTDDLGFGAEFLGRVRLVTSVASLVGVYCFQRYLKHLPLRPLFLAITLVSTALGMTSLILVEHWNRIWGISDQWFSLGDSLILTVAGQIAFMPILVLAARLCPPGIEATFFALLMSIFNLAGALSHELGAGLMHLLGVTEHQFQALPLLVIITNLSSLLPLPFLHWLPSTTSPAAESDPMPEPFSQPSVSSPEG
ncbi:MAG: folate/biopterin family MFS transporter [Synechococcales cyanobacterium]